MIPNFRNTLDFAREFDTADPLASFRNRFHIPKRPDGRPVVYFCGNSLGLQPKKTREVIEAFLDDWERLGVEGHVQGSRPWMPYHELVAESLAKIVGAKPSEVVAMNSLTVNLHLLMASFYRPMRQRYKILNETNAFPSDQYAVDSQARFHGFPPEKAVIEGGSTTESILEAIAVHRDSLALVMVGGINYLTGTLFDMKRIAEAAHAAGAAVGFDLAHVAGNVPLALHDWEVDFAVWCSYKYLNGGPGSIGGAFVHENYHRSELPRFEGWWGHDKKSRFLMPGRFFPIPTAEAWQISNPSIMPLAALRASLDLFDEAGMERLRQKSLLLTGYMEELLASAGIEGLSIVTPTDPEQRGAQLSLRHPGGKQVHEALTGRGIVSDWREPDIIRVAPVPLYNSFDDVKEFVEILKESASE